MISTIKTNERFAKLTNLDIKTHYRKIEFYAFPSDFLSALAYWITSQNPNDYIVDLGPALNAFKRYLMPFFPNPLVPEQFTFNSLNAIINEDTLEKIPEILDLNKLKPDFIDLGALARNVFYMILREQITQRG